MTGDLLAVVWRDIETEQKKQFEALGNLPRLMWGDPMAAKPKPERPCTKDEMRLFILQQMIEATDEPAKAACRRYVLRNGLLVVD